MSAGTIPNASGVQRLEGWIAVYGTGILRICYLYLRDAALAQDAMQDTFVKAWRKMDTFEGRNGSSEKTWLTHIAINTCRDYRRSRWLRFVDMRQSIEELPLPVHQVTPEERELFQSVLALLLAAAGAVAAVLLGGGRILPARWWRPLPRKVKAKPLRRRKSGASLSWPGKTVLKCQKT